MPAVQVSVKIDKKIRDEAQLVFENYGLDLPTAIRSMITIAARKHTMPFVIGKRPISLNGDEFENDTEYFKQIPGYWESIIEASNEPLEKLASAKECGWDV
jgi:addiction module RelB/DinJ family antitoxin